MLVAHIVAALKSFTSQIWQVVRVVDCKDQCSILNRILLTAYLATMILYGVMKNELFKAFIASLDCLSVCNIRSG